MSNHTLLLGAHVSIVGGFDKAIARGESIECTCIQIFVKSNRQWHAKNITKHDAEKFHDAVKKSPIKKKNIVAHSSYLINIGSANSDTFKKSLNGLVKELRRCEVLHIPGLVLHPGSRGKSDEKETLDRIARGLDLALEQGSNKTKIILETTAGQGTNVGYTFEHISYLRKKTHNKRQVGVCLDTCHVFAAGYEIRTKKSYENLWRLFDKQIGLEHLLVIHLNDSKKGINSHIDRHEHIGKGKIGIDAFKFLLKDKRFFDIPKILETPAHKGLASYKKNMQTLFTLI